MADSSSLIAAIDKLVEEKTFGLDALTAIHDLRKKAEALQRDKETLERESNSKEQGIAKRDSAIREKGEAIALKDAEIAAYKKREQEAFDAIQKAAVAAATAEAYKDALKTVFAPAVFREQVYKSVPVFQPYSGGGGNMTTQPETSTIGTRSSIRQRTHDHHTR